MDHRVRSESLPCHPEPKARDLLVASPKSGGRCSARPVFRSLSRASHLSLLVQRKSGPKKAHPVGCARRCAPGPRASRGFSTRRPCLVEKRAASCRAPCGPDPRNPSQPGAPVDQGQKLRARRVYRCVCSVVVPSSHRARRVKVEVNCCANLDAPARDAIRNRQRRPLRASGETERGRMGSASGTHHSP
jgi:hypothetical protein